MSVGSTRAGPPGYAPFAGVGRVVSVNVSVRVPTEKTCARAGAEETDWSGAATPDVGAPTARAVTAPRTATIPAQRVRRDPLAFAPRIERSVILPITCRTGLAVTDGESGRLPDSQVVTTRTVRSRWTPPADGSAPRTDRPPKV